ncbi:MAG: c-type cytochrome [Candidatus Scalindua sp.]|nr:c-type cytochrome [Candidatus Scalindua sp.]
MKKNNLIIRNLELLAATGLFIFSIIVLTPLSIRAEANKDQKFYLEIEELYNGKKEYKQLPIQLEDPYDRSKNGPTLKNVIHKASKEWLKKWIDNPTSMIPNARMPRLMLSESEIEAVLAYLTSIADKDIPRQKWDEYLMKSEDDMTDDEYDEMNDLSDKGKGVWGRARCNICHPVKGKGGSVDVGPDLGRLAEKLNRDWLYMWIKEPKSHFRDTQMPRYRFSDDEIRQLVEFLMQSYDFKPEESDDEENESDSQENDSGSGEPEDDTEKEGSIRVSSLIPEGSLIEKGKRIIELNRCTICHEIEGIADLLPVKEPSVEPENTFAHLLNDVRCMTCHKIQGNGGSYAPELTHEGSKLKQKWIKGFLQKPDIIRPLLQQMPKFNITEDEAELAVEFIEEYFVNDDIPVAKFADREPTDEEISKGKELYDVKGCRSCHAIQEGGIVGPTLKRVGDRLENGFIYHHLKNPHLEVPDGVEPNFQFSDEEAVAITNYLMSCKDKEKN